MNIPTLNIYVCIYAYICMYINIYIHWECSCISALIMVVLFSDWLVRWQALEPVAAGQRQYQGQCTSYTKPQKCELNVLKSY